MTDRYERDKDGTITGKAQADHPQPASDPAPANNGRPVDVAPANSTLASRAKGEKAKPMPEKNPYGNSTLADRTKATAKRDQKKVHGGDVEDKAVAKKKA